MSESNSSCDFRHSSSATLFALNYLYKGYTEPLSRDICIKDLCELADEFVLEGLKNVIIDYVVQEYLHSLHEVL